MGFGEIFFWDTAGSLFGQDLYLAPSGSQSQHRIGIILPTHRASRIIRQVMNRIMKQVNHKTFQLMNTL